MSPPASTARPSLKPLAWSIAAFLAGVLLNLERLPFWATAAALLCAAWTLAGHANRVRLPGRYVKAALVLAVIGVVLALFRTLNGLRAGTTLLALMGALKLIESRKRRDRYIVIGVGIYLLLAACLAEQSLVYAPLYAADAWVCCCALLAASHPQSSLGHREALLLAARSLLAALPIAVLGFLFFPRLSGSLWALPDSGAGVTGLSDTLTPGAISDLSESSRVAFRVWFDGPPPPPQDRYWRGPVLSVFDGRTWTRPPPWWFRELSRRRSGPSGASGRHRYHYRVALEPSDEPWMPTLETAESAPRGARLTSDHVLVGLAPVTRPVSYNVVSDTAAPASRPIDPRARELDLALPSNRNPRALALGRRLRREAGSDAAFVGAVLGYLKAGGFKYSLTPPRLGANSVDDFLFGTRTGFCGHFASAFVTLMRAGGVPARIVTGYLGGEWNPIGGYLEVRDSDAHAWAEVWLDGRGWTRVDPTAIVAPERLYRNIDTFLPGALPAPERALLDARWIVAARNAWDAANAWWTDEVVGFNLRSQLALLERLGIPSPRAVELAGALALSLVLWLAAIAWHLGRLPRPPRPDRIARAYRRLCVKLAQAGVPRPAGAGPLAYADAIAEHRPDLASGARALIGRYADLRYGRSLSGSDERRLADFERAVARWRVSPRPPRARVSRERRSGASARGRARD